MKEKNEIIKTIEFNENIKAFLLPTEAKRLGILLNIQKWIRTKQNIYLEEVLRNNQIFEMYSLHNLITTRGRNVLTGLLAGDTTYTGEINYGALGTGTTPVANSDIKLETETFRNAVASQAFADNVAYVDFFYDATEVVGTFTEFGNFIDGTGSADSGRIFSHFLTGGWVKPATQSLFVSCQYTLL